MAIAPRTLIGISYSPWTEKARWALDHHGVRYRYQEHLPMLGELGLRFRLRNQPGKASVPVLVGEEGPIAGSMAIAREADRLGGGPPLFPAEADDQIRGWDERSDHALGAGRALGLPRLAASPEAKRESLPGWVPGALRGLMAPTAGLAMRFLTRKYALAEAPGEEALVEVLGALREALAGRPHLFGAFSYADVTMATALQFVAPVDDRWIRLGPGQRAAWTRQDLAHRFGDLLAWRDALYARSRARGPE